MTKAVFTTRANSIYDDIPEIRYHFPGTYLNVVEAARDDLIVYYEPRRGDGRQAYFAVAKVSDVVPDYDRPNHYYAYIQTDSYLELVRPVGWQNDNGAYESGLLKADGTANRGLFGRAVRTLDETAFAEILTAGLARDALLLDRQPPITELQPGFIETGVPFIPEPRAVIETLEQSPIT